MSELPSKDVFFRTEVADLFVSYGDFGDQEIAKIYREHPSIITINDADLTVRQAIELRDWLNKVLP